jgi:hypothetical protein
MHNQKMEDAKKAYGISLSPAQMEVARKWAHTRNASISAMASATVNLLCGLPLKGRELVVEAALRELLNAPQSAEEAQTTRRISALEADVERLRADFEAIRGAGASPITNNIQTQGGDAVHRKNVSIYQGTPTTKNPAKADKHGPRDNQTTQ